MSSFTTCEQVLLSTIEFHLSRMVRFTVLLELQNSSCDRFFRRLHLSFA